MGASPPLCRTSRPDQGTAHGRCGWRRSKVMDLLLRACTVQKTWCPVHFGLAQVRRIRCTGRFHLDDVGAHVAEQPPRTDSRISVPSSGPGCRPAVAGFSASPVLVLSEPIGDDLDRVAQLVALIRSGAARGAGHRGSRWYGRSPRTAAGCGWRAASSARLPITSAGTAMSRPQSTPSPCALS